jgi:hypothetical protein
VPKAAAKPPIPVAVSPPIALIPPATLPINPFPVPNLRPKLLIPVKIPFPALPNILPVPEMPCPKLLKIAFNTLPSLA